MVYHLDCYLSKLNVLDLGFWWGRIIRLLYKYTPSTQIYGVYAWQQSINLCYNSNVKTNLAKIDDICNGIHFNTKFDIVFSFSVFTHLSNRSVNAGLREVRKSIYKNVTLTIITRPIEFWDFLSNKRQIPIKELIQSHNNEGFAFLPHEKTYVDGDITYGDTSINIDYIINNWTDWELIYQKLTDIVDNDNWAIRKITNKYEDALNIIDGNVDFVPPVEIVPDSSGTLKFTSTTGETYLCNIFDGHHWFFMCELAGIDQIHYKLNI